MKQLILLGLLLLIPVVAAHGAEHSGPGAFEESPEQPFVAGRLALYAGLSASLGAGLILLLRPPDVHESLLRTMAAGAGLQAVALVQLSILEARTLEVDYASYLRAAEGFTTIVRVLLTLFVVAIAWAAWRRFGPWHTLTRLGLVLSIFLAWMQAALSHAGGRTTFATVLDWTHMVTAGAWLGGLVWYAILVWRGDGDDAFRRRWSNAALILAVTFVATGIANAFQSLGGANLAQPGLLWDYPYGRSLILKTSAVAVALGFAVVNRLIVHGAPLLVRLAKPRQALAAEALAAGVVLVMASLLVSSAPLPENFDPLDYETFQQDIQGQRHGGIAYIVPYPQIDEEQLIVFDIQNLTTGQAVHWSQISFTVRNIDTLYNQTYDAEHRGGPLAGARATFFPEAGRYLIEVAVLDGPDRYDRISLGLQL